jgi:hypothetical protein
MTREAAPPAMAAHVDARHVLQRVAEFPAKHSPNEAVRDGPMSTLSARFRASAANCFWYSCS